MDSTGYHVEKLVRLYRRCQEAEEVSREAQQQANRSVNYRWDDDGSLILTARLPAELGALVLKAIHAAVEVSPTPNPPAVMHFNYVPDQDPIDEPSRSARHADALGLLAEAFLHHGAQAVSDGDRHQVIVHVSAETLKCSAAGCCEIEDGASISAETARRFACDASIVALIENRLATTAGHASASRASLLMGIPLPAGGTAREWTTVCVSRVCLMEQREKRGRIYQP